MKAFLCIHLPNWSIDVIKRQSGASPAEADEIPSVLTSESPSGLVVKRCCQRATAAGIKINMPLTLAQALTPEIRIFNFQPREDLRALFKLARWLNNFSPLVGFDNEITAAISNKSLHKISPLYYGLILDVTGCEKLFNGHFSLARLILSHFQRWQVITQIAVATTIGAAWALSRYSNQQLHITDKDSILESIAALPPQALRISIDNSSLLNDLGICSIKQLLELPRSELAARFGNDLLIRIKQALGEQPETFRALQPIKQYQAQKYFESPLKNTRHINKTLIDLLQEVLQQLRASKKEASYFSLTLKGNDLAGRIFTVHKQLRLIFATHNCKHLEAVLQPIIESLQAPQGFFFFAVNAQQIRNIYQQSLSLFKQECSAPKASSEPECSELINLLGSRLGINNIRQVEFSESYLPERSFRFKPFSSEQRRKVQQADKINTIVKNRPAYLLNPPEPLTATALLPDRPPVQLRLSSMILSVIAGYGPERIKAEWWQDNAQPDDINADQRDYFTLQDQHGRWLWVFRNLKDQKWYLHGLWL